MIRANKDNPVIPSSSDIIEPESFLKRKIAAVKEAIPVAENNPQSTGRSIPGLYETFEKSSL